MVTLFLHLLFLKQTYASDTVYYTRYIICLESATKTNHCLESSSEDVDVTISTSKAKQSVELMVVSYLNNNNIKNINYSIDRPEIIIHENHAIVYQAYHIHSYDVDEIVCTTISGAHNPYTYCKSGSQVLEILGIFSYVDSGRIIHIKKVGDKFIATGAYWDYAGRTKEVVVEIDDYGIFK